MPGWTTRISSAWAARRRRLSYTSIGWASIRLADARWIESSVQMVREVSSAAARRRPSLMSTRRYDSRSRAILGRRWPRDAGATRPASDVAVDEGRVRLFCVRRAIPIESMPCNPSTVTRGGRPRRLSA